LCAAALTTTMSAWSQTVERLKKKTWRFFCFDWLGDVGKERCSLVFSSDIDIGINVYGK
jgi:hypothetical protein